MKATRPFPAFLLVIAVVSCTAVACRTVSSKSQPEVYNLRPVSGSVATWYQSKTGIVRKIQGLEAEIYQSGTITSEIQCNVRIRNISSDLIIVDPLQFSYSFTGGMEIAKDGRDSLPAGRTIYAINPETRIREYDSLIAEENERYKQSKTVGSAVANWALREVGQAIYDPPEDSETRNPEDPEHRHNRIVDGLRYSQRFWKKAPCEEQHFVPENLSNAPSSSR